MNTLEVGFWRTYVHVGVLTYGIGGFAAFGYALATPHGPHRGLLLVLDLLSVGSWVGVFWWLGIRLVATKWRTPFFSAWTMSTFAFIGVGIVLDGGTSSPMTFFLVLPLLFAGLAYPPRTTSTLTAVGVLTAVVVGALSRHPSLWTSVVLATTMLVAGVLTTSTARFRQRLVDALVDTASHDGLTRTMTRRAFYERLEHEVAMVRRYGGGFSVILADLDHLKALNDQGGHEAGDKALQEIAHALMDGGRSTDLVGRLGGDEFCLLLPRTESAAAEHVADRLLGSIRNGEGPSLSASIGIAEWAGPDEEPDVLLRRADIALYEAKRAGRNCYRMSAVVPPPDAPAPRLRAVEPN